MRRAKIVCTLGPACSDHDTLKAMVEAGLDVARLNMSHGSHEEHLARLRLVRAVTDETGHAVGVLADLQGPKIRTETFSAGPVTLTRGDRFTITVRDVPGDATIVGTTYKGLAGDVNVGDALLIDDGKVQLRAVEVTDTDVVCEVVVGGPVSDHKGINLPGTAVTVPALSEKDAADLRWALESGVDIIALSFVRTGSDIDDVHRIMDEYGTRLPVIAKIEKPQAVENLESIVTAFDGIMVARGDLGVELPFEQVPIVQKRAIELARKKAKPVIVATQVLESMIDSPRPTRAEASDCANAVLDGTDAVMLSGETSVGRYPVECVQTMAGIITATEELGWHRIALAQDDEGARSTSQVVSSSAAWVAEKVDARYLCVFTTIGGSARRLVRERPTTPVAAFTPDPRVRSQLALSWGLETFLVPLVDHTDDMVVQVDEALRSAGRVQDGDKVVIVAGSPPGVPGSTNALRVHTTGKRD